MCMILIVILISKKGLNLNTVVETRAVFLPEISLKGVMFLNWIRSWAEELKVETRDWIWNLRLLPKTTPNRRLAVLDIMKHLQNISLKMLRKKIFQIWPKIQTVRVKKRCSRRGGKDWRGRREQELSVNQSLSWLQARVRMSLWRLWRRTKKSDIFNPTLSNLTLKTLNRLLSKKYTRVQLKNRRQRRAAKTLLLKATTILTSPMKKFHPLGSTFKTRGFSCLTSRKKSLSRDWSIFKLINNSLKYL